MKRRIISVLLAAIIAFGVVLPATVGADGTDELFSAEPRDMTPAKQDYSPGLGDRMDSVSFTINFGIDNVGPNVPVSGYPVATTYDQALAIQRKVSNITNGGHIVAYAIGQDVLRWGTAPYLIEDVNVPMGDGTEGSGYRKYKEYVEASFDNNVDVAQILEPLLAGYMRDDYATDEEIIPESCYTHDQNGDRKVGWSATGRDWYLLSLYNLYDTGYAQSAWQRMVDNWGFRTHVYYDAMIPVPEGLYNNPNLTTKYGGVITNTAMEWEAVQREIAHAWENYAISSAQEYLFPPYKGLSCYFTLPYGVMTDEDYLNTWQNSVMISTRSDEVTNLVWGSEVSSHDDSFHYEGNYQPGSAFVTRLMEHNLQYLYMLERKPLSYTNNTSVYQVVFSGGLVSTYNKKTDHYTLVENGDFIIADGNDRFIPQVGAGLKIYAYSRGGANRTWRLPDTWEGVSKVDRYRLSVNSAPSKIDTLDVADGSVTFRMNAGTPYLLVPQGDSPTPKTANFNELADGATLGSYQSLGFDEPGDPAIKVYGANARGGFGTPSVYADVAETESVAQIGMEAGAILHSMKIGNRGGQGRVVLHSSNPLNPDVMISLPETDQVYKFNTEWKYGELDSVTVKIENDVAVSNVLFDAIMYSPTSNVRNCAGGTHEYAHRRVEALCGSAGRDSDVCVYCGNEINVTVIPAIAGDHLFAPAENALTATAHNTGVSAQYCMKCGFAVESEVPKAFDSGNHVFHHDYGYNYMQTDEFSPYSKSTGAASFDVLPLDVTERGEGPCYVGVWFGDGYSNCAAYDFSSGRFVIGEGAMRFGSSMSSPHAAKAYSWTKSVNGNYPVHRFGFSLEGNTATVYLDGEAIVSSTRSSYNSSGRVLIVYSKGEFVLDNIAVSSNGYGGAADMLADFEKGDASLEGWALGGYIATDIRTLDLGAYASPTHTHTNVLVASHEATYTHGAYDEYECSLCHKRTAVETGAPLTGDVLVHVAATAPGCTSKGNVEYWYDRQITCYSDEQGKNEIPVASVSVDALGHDLMHRPAVKAPTAADSSIEYWTCSRCGRSFADADAQKEINPAKTDAVRAAQSAIEAVGAVKYREETPVEGSGIVGAFTGGNAYSVLDVGNSGAKLNADYTVEMLVRFQSVDTGTQIGGAPGAFFGCGCENFTVGYDFVSQKWGVSPTGGLFASYAFHPSESGPLCVLDDGYFHNITIDCSTSAISVFVDGTCVLNATSLVRENDRYCIFYPRLCTVEFASYAFKYNGVWLDDHLTGADILTASTWKDKNTGYGKTVRTFTGSTLADSLRSIEYAESLYEDLSENEKILVSNHVDLVRARKTYDALASGGVAPGDVDADGNINARDVTLMLRYLAGWDDPDFYPAFADYDASGRINARDIISVLRFIVG